MALYYVDGQLYDPLATTPEDDLAALQELAEDEDWDADPEPEVAWTAEDEDALEAYEARKRQRLAEQQEY